MAYSYKCSISFGLVYIPVTLHASVKTQDVGFNMLDIVRECGGKFLKGGGFVYISGEISLDEILSQGMGIGEIK